MSSPSNSTPTPLGEASLLVAICFGWFILSSVAAVAMGFPVSGSGTEVGADAGAFSDSNLLSVMGLEFIQGAIALFFLRYRGYNLHDLLPAPSWRGCFSGWLLFVAATLAWILVAQVFTRSDLNAQPITEMAANSRPSLVVVIALAMFNGLYEETFLLGYLVRAFAGAGASLALGISLLVRVLYHLYQGPIGALSVLVFGVAVSYYYWRTRNLWPAVFAHTLADAMALT